MLVPQPVCAVQHPGNVLTTIDAVHEPAKPLLDGGGLSDRSHGVRIDGGQHGEHALDAVADAHHPPEREAGGDEPDDLLIGRVFEAMYKAHRVVRDVTRRVVLCEQRIQLRAQHGVRRIHGAIVVATRPARSHHPMVLMPDVRGEGAALAWVCAWVCAGVATVCIDPGEVRAQETEDRVLRAGPVLLAPTPTSVQVMVEHDTPAPAAAEFLPRVGDPIRAEAPAAGTQLLSVEGLRPDTEYTYRVRLSTGRSTPPRRYRTPRRHERGDVHFFAYGDSRSGETVHAAIAARMLEEVERSTREAPFDFALQLGDFAARGGVDAEWVGPFRSTRALLRRLPMLPVLGNHELKPRDAGRRNYDRYLGHAMGTESYYRTRLGPLHLFVLDSNVPWTGSSEQEQWFAQELPTVREAYPDDFIVIAIHHSPLSGGLHADHEGAREHGLPLMQRYADLVLAGHDHMYERGTLGGLHWVVSGGGGSPLYSANRRREGQLAFSPEHHYLRIDIVDGRLALTPTRPDGSPIEACSFARRAPWRCEDGTPRGVIGGEAPFWFWVKSGYFWRKVGPPLGLLLLFVVLLRRWRKRRRTSR